MIPAPTEAAAIGASSHRSAGTLVPAGDRATTRPRAMPIGGPAKMLAAATTMNSCSPAEP